MKVSVRALGFLSFECPKCAFVVIEVYCFAPEHAERFLARFGGQPFDASMRGRGAKWAQWRR
jgi:hypothetical protein